MFEKTGSEMILLIISLPIISRTGSSSIIISAGAVLLLVKFIFLSVTGIISVLSLFSGRLSNLEGTGGESEIALEGDQFGKLLMMSKLSSLSPFIIRRCRLAFSKVLRLFVSEVRSIF